MWRFIGSSSTNYTTSSTPTKLVAVSSTVRIRVSSPGARHRPSRPRQWQNLKNIQWYAFWSTIPELCTFMWLTSCNPVYRSHIGLPDRHVTGMRGVVRSALGPSRSSSYVDSLHERLRMGVEQEPGAVMPGLSMACTARACGDSHQPTVWAITLWHLWPQLPRHVAQITIYTCSTYRIL